MRFPSLSFAALLPLVALPAALGVGCVTRTVYVVDDDPRPQVPPTAPAEASAPAAPYAGGGGGGVYALEEEAGIQDESDFYEPLSPYGRWVAYPGYGRVFVPATAVVGAGFRPYTHGHWEHTEWGYTWVDHHPFGWATGHYGRWFYDSSYGWAWVPGRVWAPAWVTWRSGGGYVGWAPMPPGAAFGGAYSVYDTSWVFVSYSGFGYGYVGSMLVVGPAYRTCFLSTSPYRETYVVYGRQYYRGPAEDEIVRGGGRVVHRPVREVERERPVTRPPEGTAIARSRERNRGTSGTGRDRDDVSGSGRDRDDTSGAGRDRDDTSGAGRDRDETSGGRGRDEPRGDGTDPRADGTRSDDRTRDDALNDRGRPDAIDPRNPRGADAPRGTDDDRGDDRGDDRSDDVRDPRGDFVRGEAGRVVEPRPIVVGEEGVPDAIPDPRGERGERADGRPDLGGRGDERSPYIDIERPRKQYPEDPDRVRGLERPQFAPRAPVAGPVEPRGTDPRGPSIDPRGPSIDPRGPSVDPRGPSSFDRAPVGRPSGPAIDRGPAPSRTPSMSQPRGPAVGQPSGPAIQPSQPSQPQGEQPATTTGKKDGKKDGKKGTTKGKAAPKSR